MKKDNNDFSGSVSIKTFFSNPYLYMDIKS